MAVEAKRGCGYRKVGGKYVVAGRLSATCCRMPLPLTVCPCCGEGVKQSRGWTWIDAAKMFGTQQCELYTQPALGPSCALADPAQLGKVGLLWIGEQFYPTAQHFLMEANGQGISRRVSAIPRDYKAGATWLMFAHPKGMLDAGTGEWVPAVIALCRPHGFELIVLQSRMDAADIEGSEAAQERERDAKRGVTWVPVPDDDPDHRGSAFDKEPKQAPARDLLTDQHAN
jgi:hypothetical protein